MKIEMAFLYFKIVLLSLCRAKEKERKKIDMTFFLFFKMFDRLYIADIYISLYVYKCNRNYICKQFFQQCHVFNS